MTRTNRPRPAAPLRRLPAVLLSAILMSLVHFPAPAAAGGIDGMRRSLDRPLYPQTVFLAFGPTLGTTPGYARMRAGYSGAIVFHPSSAADFLPDLFRWNTGLVLHGEYRIVDEKRSLLTASAVLRKYIGDMRHTPPRVSPFVGGGGGLALAGYPVRTMVDNEDGSTTVSLGSNEEYFLSFLIEAGYELAPSPRILIVAKAQWRNYIYHNLDYSNWTLHLQVGIPLPW